MVAHAYNIRALYGSRTHSHPYAMRLAWVAALMVCLVMMAWPQAAHAGGRIVNLDDQPHTVLVESLGRVHSFVLYPGQSRYFSAHVGYIYLQQGRSLHLYNGSEYAIWPPGKLYLQQRYNRACCRD